MSLSNLTFAACDFSHFTIQGVRRMMPPQSGGFAMYVTGQSIHPVNTIFGTGFVPEHHAETDQPSLLAHDTERRQLDFAAILEALRSALGIRR